MARFGIETGELCAVVAESDTVIRYRCPNNKIDDFWVNDIDMSSDTFGTLQVTYDMKFYDEWYLPLTADEEISYKTDTELTVKSMLLSPKTADFPAYDWEMGKNDYYIALSSYVDSENAFGAKIRNNFTLIYSAKTGDLIYGVLNNEVFADSGTYIPTEELIMALVDNFVEENETTTDDNAVSENVNNNQKDNYEDEYYYDESYDDYYYEEEYYFPPPEDAPERDEPMVVDPEDYYDEDEGGALDGIVTELTDEELYELENSN